MTVENFNISSNITAKTSTSILRFIAEEACLFISNKVNEDRDRPENLTIDLRNDYVCVVDMGLFELSLRLTDNGEGEFLLEICSLNFWTVLVGINFTILLIFFVW